MIMATFIGCTDWQVGSMNSGRPDLSLAGSQINVVSASHRPGSAKRPNLTNSSTSGGHPRTGTATKVRAESS